MSDGGWPDDWSYLIDDQGKGYDVIRAPWGFVTIDLKRRCFRSGISTAGRPINTECYGGRGWKARLVDDAVSWLKKLKP